MGWGEEIHHPEGYSTYDWELVGVDKKDSFTVPKIVSEIRSGNPFDHMPDYDQTALHYEFKSENGKYWSSEKTGIIENEHNIWMHPPRNDLFRILEINPFPYVKNPYKPKIGEKWNWNMKIGDFWGDKRWLEWEGSIENKYTYKITGRKKLKTKLGKLDCYVVESEAVSRIGKTYLTSYFNTTHGFVKLDYTNIDGSKIVIEMAETKMLTERELATKEDGSILREGDAAADFTVDRLEGADIKLSDLKGKVVLLNFWATWCGPCMKELQAVPEEIIKPFENEDFVFLPIARGEGEEKIKEKLPQLKEKGIDISSLNPGFDPDKKVWHEYAVSGIPKNYLIDKNGVIRYISLGYSGEGDLDMLAQEIKKLLEE